LPAWSVWTVFAAAIAAWLLVSYSLWWARKKHWAHSR